MDEEADMDAITQNRKLQPSPRPTRPPPQTVLMRVDIRDPSVCSFLRGTGASPGTLPLPRPAAGVVGGGQSHRQGQEATVWSWWRGGRLP